MGTLHVDLINAFKQRRGGVFVGAGLSVASGLPTWKEMLGEMIKRARGLSFADQVMIDECEGMIENRSKYLMMASVLREQLGPEFPRYIEDRFAAETLEPNPLHRAVVNLPWQFIVTTNYDRLIEQAYNEKYGGKKTADPILFKNPGSAASNLFRQRPFVLKVHGDAKLEPDNIILSERDYRNIIHHQTGLQSLLQTLFTTYTILFVGASLDDPDLQLLLGYVHSAFHGKTPTHFAIVSKEERGRVDAHSFHRDFNIQLITYEAGKRESQVIAALEELTAEAS
jgi:hypothetical protein